MPLKKMLKSGLDEDEDEASSSGRSK